MSGRRAVDEAWLAAEIGPAVRRVYGERAVAFLDGGFRVARHAGDEICWSQVTLSNLRRDLATTVRKVESICEASIDCECWFYVHKENGFRIRFRNPQLATADRDDAVRRAFGGMADWFGDIRVGRYEPEVSLFGGAPSLAGVHALQQADSAGWIRFHRDAQSKSAWLYSLAVVRALLDGLRIVGWEDLDVWGRLSSQLGRRRPGRNAAGRTDDGIRRCWHALATGPEAVLGNSAALLRHVGEVQERASSWRTNYFERSPTIGPREGAALFIMFVWNRALLPFGVQCALVRALGDRAARP